MRRRVLLMIAMLAVIPAFANDFYIDPIAGTDDGDGSAAHPWPSVAFVFDTDRIETQDWPSFPYDAGMALVAVNAGAPVRAGDTLWLRDGYHGDIVVEHAYNTAPITIAAAPGATPHVRSVVVQAAQNWIIRGLSVSPSYSATNEAITMVEISDHNYFGPTWDVDFGANDLFSVDDASGWGADEWVNLASSGIDVGAARIDVHDNRIRNVRFGIGVDGPDSNVRRNVIDGFSADGLRGLGDRDVFEYNRVQNDKIGDDADVNHDDGFQSWSVGDGGVGTGEVTGIVLRGNVFINSTDPGDPLRNSMQGIGCFDGFFVGWVVENNVVVTDHWHGISFYGMRDSRIVNNTVIDLADGEPGPPWIMVTDHKNGTPSSDVIVRNNLAADFELSGDNVTSDHNVQFDDASAFFVSPPFDLHLLPTAFDAIDMGNVELAPPVDVEGEPRPQGAGYDIGAYELRVDVILRNGFDAA